MTQFGSDELILTLISLVRAINPTMLQAGSDGFSVDLTSLEKKPRLTPDEQLLLKLHAALASGDAAGNYRVELSAQECQRLSQMLGTLETLQQWPEDVLALSRGVRARLAGGGSSSRVCPGESGLLD